MLKKSRISTIEILTDKWHKERLGKFTSSEIFNLMGSGAMAYVRRKVGEEITGNPSRPDIDTDATKHGNSCELEALYKFKALKEIEIMVSQVLVTEKGSRFGSTPDALICISENPDQTEYEVETVEVKCPLTFDNYLLLFACDTAQDLKAAKKEYYWQVLDQIDNCDCKVGHFVAYHPDFKSGNIKHIRIQNNEPTLVYGIKKYPVHEDLKLLRQKKKWAEEQFNLIRDSLLTAITV